MTESEFTTLDHEEPIQVPGNVFAEPANEYSALLSLREGLEHLYRLVSHYDQVVEQRIKPQGNTRTIILGNSPYFEALPIGLLTCAFHWYAVSACQYVRTVGAIAYRQDNGCPRPDKYVEKVIPEVVAFRDKVAAHFAGMSQNKKDNEAERLASLMPQLGFQDNSFCVGAYTIRTVRGGKVRDSKSIRWWSIRNIHDRLRRRYWPDGNGPVVGTS